LWQRRRGSMLTLEAYVESGGVQGAIAKRAETVYGSFGPDQQAIARQAVLRLTQPGEGTEDTRRRAALRELVPGDEQAPAVEEVVHTLADARLLTIGGEAAPGESWVDLSHEALIRGWPRLRSWIEEDRAGLRVHRRLTEAAQEWERLDHDEGVLLRGARLAEAVEWRTQHERALNELERRFLDESVAAQVREQAARERARRRLAYAGFGLAAVFLVLAGLAGWQWAAAEEQRATAEQQRLLALSRKLAAEARSTTRPARSA
jgi:hypothetical protein